MTMKKWTDPKITALKFNEYINNQNIEGLSGLMTEEHTFISISEESYKGKDTMTKGWTDFINKYPDYMNFFNRVESRDNLVIMIGYSTCSNEKSLDGPSIWTAKIKNNLVDEWRVYEDTEEIRKKLGIK